MMRGKKRQTGLAAGAMVILFLLAGMLSLLLTENYGWKLDLTENRLYTLSEDTKEILSQLEQPVSIIVFNREGEYPLLPKNLLARYSGYSSKIQVRYCDPYREPKLVREYEELGYKVELNDLMIQSLGGRKQLKLTDLYELNPSRTQVERLAAEQEITSGIHLVANEERGRILFTDGHGEEPSASLMDLFSQNHYQTSYAELSVQGIDRETAALVICAPRRDFSEEEILCMEEYLLAGGGVMVFWEPGTEGLERLAGLLEDWGIRPTRDLVEEPKLYVSGSPLNVAATYGQHPINQYFKNNRYYVVAPSCVALEQLYESQGTTKTGQVLRSSKDASAGGQAQQGPFSLVLSSERRVTSEIKDQVTSKAKDPVASGAEGQVTGRILVCGSKGIYGDDMLSSEKLANGDFLVQAAGWCVGTEDMIHIPPKEMGPLLLPIISSEAKGWAILLLGILPLGTLAVGAGISLRRRYL